MRRNPIARLIVPMLLSLLALSGTAAPAEAAQAAVHQWWGYSGAGMWNLDTTVTVQKPGPTRFFAHQFGFEGGDGGYMGIQQTPHGRQAIFSVWNSPGAAQAGPGASCETFGGEGVGWHCQLPYDWAVGRPYRLRVWKVDAHSDGATRWVAAVADTTTGKESTIGYLWTRSGQKQLRPSSAVWIEDYGMTTGNCATETPATATFTYPTGNAGQVTATRASGDTAACGNHRSAITDHGNSVTLAE